MHQTLKEPAVPHRPLAAIVVAALLALGPAIASAASSPEDRPGLHALNADIRFHLSFDDATLEADLAAGEHEPLAVEGEPRFEDGAFGKALILGGDDGVEIEYATPDNIDLSSPGAMSFWIAPRQWHQRDEVDQRPYLRMFNLRAAGRGHFFIQRQGFRYVTRDDGTLSRRHDRFQVGFYNLSDWDNVIHSSGVSRDWQARDWRLVVINWDRAGYAVSYNGESPSRREFPRSLDPDDFAPDSPPSDRFTLGHGSREETTLVDELTIYRRPLEPSEIAALYADRGQR